MSHWVRLPHSKRVRGFSLRDAPLVKAVRRVHEQRLPWHSNRAHETPAARPFKHLPVVPAKNFNDRFQAMEMAGFRISHFSLLKADSADLSLAPEFDQCARAREAFELKDICRTKVLQRGPKVLP